jgi:hypothetical protein
MTDRRRARGARSASGKATEARVPRQRNISIADRKNLSWGKGTIGAADQACVFA